MTSFIDPVSSDISSDITHFNTYAHEWWDPNGALATLHEINPVRLAWIQTQLTSTNININILKSSPLQDLHILDVGCGGGILSESLAKQGAHVTGIDLASEVLDVARMHANLEKLTINYRHTSSQALAQNMPAHFDVVVCMELLEHVEQPQQVVQDCAQLLKKGGWAFFSTIHRSYKAYAQAIIAAEYLLKIVPKHTHFYDKFIQPAELIHMAQQAGLKAVDLSGLSYSPFKAKGRRAALSQDVSVNYVLACQKTV